MGRWSAGEKLDQKAEEKFKNLADLWSAWQMDKSDNLVRLQFRINSTYDNFTRAEKIQFTEWMIAQGKLDDNIIRAIRLMNGHLERLT